MGPGPDLAHTAYGCLVADSSGNPNYAVCDGYTLAMEYLLQQCGIEAAFIGGMAGFSQADAGGHAWNIVKSRTSGMRWMRPGMMQEARRMT